MLSATLALLCLCAMAMLSMLCLVVVRRMMKQGNKKSAMHTVVLAEGTVVALAVLAYSLAPHVWWLAAMVFILSMLILGVAGSVATNCSTRCEELGDKADGTMQRAISTVSQYFDELDRSGHDIFLSLRRTGRVLLRWLLVAIGVFVLLDIVAAPFGVVRPWLSDGWDILLAELNGASNATSRALAQNATDQTMEASPPHEVIRNIGLLFAGILGIVFTAWRAVAYDRQTVVAEEGLLTDRFNKAAEQLGSEHVTVRIAAINALWRIGVDSKSQDDKRAVLDVLCGFVRNTTSGLSTTPAQPSSTPTPPGPEETESTETPDTAVDLQDLEKPICPPDVQTVLDFLGKRMDALNFKPWRMDYVVDLSGSYLAGCNLANRSLPGVDLRGANLQRANLDGANLQKARLDGANLQEASLFQAKLQRAILHGANLQEASIDKANLQGANLVEAKLQRASLICAKLQRAHLLRAKLTRVSLADAKLQGSRLDDAHMWKTNLIDAKLQKVNLQRADLRRASLLRADMRMAKLDDANLQGAYLPCANLQEASLIRAKLMSATLTWANLSDADFRGADELTQEQIDAACWDGAHPLKLPAGMTCPENYCEWDFIQQKVVPIDPPDTVAPCPAEEQEEDPESQ